MINITKISDEYLYLFKNFNIEMNYQLSTVVAEILKEMKPIAIYLIGSFGRGEGSIRVLKSKRIIPNRDYDVLVVVNKRVAGKKIIKIMNKVNAILGFVSPDSKHPKFQGFCVWITQATLKEVSSFTLLKFFELKESSRLLWGQDIRSLIKLELGKLLRYNFVLILFSKIHGLLGLLELSILRENNNYEAVDLIYECLKTYVEIGTCLSLLIRKYKPSFIERSLEVAKNFDNYFRDLKKKIPDLPEMISNCAYRRLILDDAYLNTLRLRTLFLKTRDDLKVVLCYFVEKVYGSHLVIKELNTMVIEEVIGFYLMNNLGLSSKFLTKLVTELYLRYACLRFFIEGRKSGYKVKIMTLFHCHSNIMIRLWLLGLKVLESIKEDLTVDTGILGEVVRELNKIVDLNPMRKNWIEQFPDATFSCIKKTIVELMNIADKIIHRKDY